MRVATLMLLVAATFAACGGGVLDSEVDPVLTDSANPEVNPVVDLDVPISVLGSGGAATTTSSLGDAGAD